MNRIYILWEGVSEWERFDGTLEEAIEEVTGSYRYWEYGKLGALIIQGQVRCEISETGEAQIIQAEE